MTAMDRDAGEKAEYSREVREVVHEQSKETDRDFLYRVRGEAEERVTALLEEGRAAAEVIAAGHEHTLDDELVTTFDNIRLQAMEEQQRLFRRLDDAAHEDELLVAGDEEGEGAVEVVDAKSAEAIVAYGSDEEVARLAQNLDDSIDCRQLLNKAKERDAYLYQRMLENISVSPERYPLDEDLASQLMVAGHHDVVAARLGEVSQPSPALANTLVSAGQGWAVLAKFERFQGWEIDEQVIERLRVTESITDDVAEDLRSALGSPERMREIIDLERLASLQALVSAEQVLCEYEGQSEEYNETVEARNRFSREAAPDTALLRKYEERYGVDAMQSAAYLFDRGRPSWRRGREWQETVKSLFAVTDEQFFDTKTHDVLFSAYAPLSTNERDRDVSAYHERMERRWVADRTLEVNAVHLERKISTILSLFDGNSKDRWEAGMMMNTLESLLATASRSGVKERYVPSVAKLLGDDRLCFSGDKYHGPDRRAVIFFQLYALEIAADQPEVVKDAYHRFLGENPSLYSYRDMLPVALKAFHGEEGEALLRSTIQASEHSKRPMDAKNIIRGVAITSDNPEYRAQVINALAQEGIAIDEHMLVTWFRCSPAEAADRARTAESNIETMSAIEKERPGATALLRQNFGIENFGRYPKQMLIDQYDNRDDCTKPFGIIISSKSDHNGAFNRDDVYGSLREQIADTYHVRVYEAGSRFGVARALVDAHKRYTNAGAGKIAFGIIAGHGSPDGIQFGDGDDRVRLEITDIQGRGTGRAGAFFEEGATMLLRSCSTGREGGIAQKMSEATGLRVIGPDIPISSEKIDVTFDDKGKPVLDVKYSEGVAMAYAAGMHQENSNN